MSELEKISKYLSYILRHKPDSIGVNMDKYGWVDIDELIEKSKDISLSREIIEKVVKNSNKQRFSIKENKIRANQGHSIEVDLQLVPQKPPQKLLARERRLKTDHYVCCVQQAFKQVKACL